jgi:hypothetical protein
MAAGKKERNAVPDDCDADENSALDAPITLEELEECDIREMAKDKFKSRRLQRTVSRGDEVLGRVLEMAEPYFMELVRDQYGNYLSQKILEAASAEQFETFFAQLKPEALALARDTHGTRAVQKLVEQAIARDRTLELLEVLPVDAAEELAHSVTGFHVVGRMIELLPASEARKFVDVLCGDSTKALTISKDQWGCCVVKRCIDRSDIESHGRIVSAITANAQELVQDPFGNYVIQHLILSGNGKPSPYVTDVIDSMKGKIYELALLKFSSNVLEKCLTHAYDTDRNKIINEILSPPDHSPSEAVKTLVFHQYGNYVFQQALEVGKEPQYSLLVQHSRQMVQDVMLLGDQLEAQPSPNLPAEQMRRLAQKLVKRCPAMSEGIYDSACFDGFDPSMYYGGWDPSMEACGEGMTGWPDGMAFDFPTNFPPGWEPLYDASQWPRGKGWGKGGRGKGRKGGGRGRGSRNTNPKADAAAAAVAAAAAFGLPTTEDGKVGRVVGYWPNYEITFDNVGAGGARKSGRRAKSKAKA